MSTAYVAVIRAGRTPDDPDHLAGATAVLSLSDLASCAWPDHLPAVLLDSAGPSSGQAASLLQTLENLDENAPDGGLVVASVLPVTDTLKRVTADGVLTGTADRENHRFVALPVATRLGLLRAAAARQARATTAGEILTALVEGGATVVAGP